MSSLDGADFEAVPFAYRAAKRNWNITKNHAALRVIRDEHTILAALLKSLRIRRVVCRAGNEMQAQILSRIGADAVVKPEDEAADRWGHRLLTPFMIDHVELGQGYALIQMAAPGAWEGKTLAELDLRKKHNVAVVAIKRRVATSGPTGADTFEERVVDVPMPSSRLGHEDTLVIAGFDRDLERLPR